MNHSPLNDPGFKKAREEARLRAGKKRRIKTLILLSITTLLTLTCTILLGNAVLDAVPEFKDAFFNKKPEKTYVLPETSPSPTPSPTPSDPISTEQPPPTPSENTSPDSETPSIILPSDPNVHVTTVYIDAGHGFTNSLGYMDNGAGAGTIYHELSGGLYEKDLNLQIALKVQALLEAKGYVVIMSRTDDAYEYLKPSERAANVAKSDADCSVSIHANTAANSSASGTRVYYCDKGSSPILRNQFASSFATAADAKKLLDKKTMVLEDHNVGVSGDGGYLMCNSTGNVPSVLVETCFLSNKSDAEKAITETWQTQMAEAIVEAIVENFPWSYSYID